MNSLQGPSGPWSACTTLSSFVSFPLQRTRILSFGERVTQKGVIQAFKQQGGKFHSQFSYNKWDFSPFCFVLLLLLNIVGEKCCSSLVVDRESTACAPGVRPVAAGVLLASVPDAPSPQYWPGLYCKCCVWNSASVSQVQKERFNLGELKCLLLFNCYENGEIEEFCW